MFPTVDFDAGASNSGLSRLCSQQWTMIPVFPTVDYDAPVPNSAGWYANDPEFAHYYDEVPATGRSDPGRVDTVG